MLRTFVAAAVCASAVLASPALTAETPAAAASDTVCKYVVSAERGSKPFQMCMTKAQWAAKAERDAEDANRIVCRYEEVSGSRLKARKICQPASQWAEDRDMHRGQVEQMQRGACVPGAGC